MTAKNLQAKRQRERIGHRSQMRQAKVSLPANLFPPGSLASVSNELLVRMNFKINLTGAIHLTSFVIEKWRNAQIPGVIVNVSSGSAKGVPGLATYAAAKAGIDAFSRAVAEEYGSKGIQIFAMNPGHVNTRLQTAVRCADPNVFPSANLFKDHFRTNSIIEPSQSALQIFYLLTHPSEFTNGSCLKHVEIESRRSAAMPGLVNVLTKI